MRAFFRHPIFTLYLSSDVWHRGAGNALLFSSASSHFAGFLSNLDPGHYDARTPKERRKVTAGRRCDDDLNYLWHTIYFTSFLYI